MSNLSNTIHEILHPTPIHVHLGFKGKFEVEVRHHEYMGMDDYGDPIYKYIDSDETESDNLILNVGLDMIGGFTGGNVINGIAVGTGNSTPTATQTKLDAGVGASTNLTSSSQSFVTTAPYAAINTYVFTFAVGGAVGNIAEIAAIPSGSTATTGNAFSRALIQVAGSPGVIPLLSTDQLIATYILQAIMPADVTGTFPAVTDGVSATIGYTMRPIGFYSSSNSSYSGQKAGMTINNGGSFPGWFSGLGAQTTFQAVTAQPNQGGTNIVSWGNGGGSSLAAYTSGSYQRVATFTSPTAHPGTIGNAVFTFNWFAFQLIFSPTIPFLTTQTLSWPVTISWANA